MEARTGPNYSPVGCCEPRIADLVSRLASNRLASGSPVCARLELEGTDRIDDVCFCIRQRRAHFGLGVRTNSSSIVTRKFQADHYRFLVLFWFGLSVWI